MTAPRVAHVIDSGGLYGAERVVMTLMTAQTVLGAAPLLISLGRRDAGDKPIEIEARARGLAVEAVRMRDGLNFAGAWRVLRVCRAAGVEVLHLHGYKPDILLGSLPARLRGLPAVATVHGWTGGAGWNRMRLYEWLDARALGRLDRVVVVSPAMLDHPRLRGRGWPVEVVPNAIDLPQPKRTAPEREPGRPLRIVAVGRLSPEKGHAELFRALAALVGRGVDARLAVLGEGPERGALEALARGLAIADRVRLAGYVTDVDAVLAESDLFVLPSVTEGLPLTVLEAMSHGLPVVASAVGGVPELLADGAGRLVPPGNVEALTAALAELAADPAERRRVGERGRSKRESRPGPEAMARRYFEVYRDAMRGFRR